MGDRDPVASDGGETRPASFRDSVKWANETEQENETKSKASYMFWIIIGCIVVAIFIMVVIAMYINRDVKSTDAGGALEDMQNPSNSIDPEASRHYDERYSDYGYGSDISVDSYSDFSSRDSNRHRDFRRNSDFRSHNSTQDSRSNNSIRRSLQGRDRHTNSSISNDVERSLQGRDRHTTKSGNAPVTRRSDRGVNPRQNTDARAPRKDTSEPLRSEQNSAVNSQPRSNTSDVDTRSRSNGHNTSQSKRSLEPNREQSTQHHRVGEPSIQS